VESSYDTYFPDEAGRSRLGIAVKAIMPPNYLHFSEPDENTTQKLQQLEDEPLAELILVICQLESEKQTTYHPTRGPNMPTH